MLTNKRLLIIAILQYLIILGFHLVYSFIYCTKDMTRLVFVWSICVLIALIFFIVIFQNFFDMIIYVTMFLVAITVTYVGYLLESLAFGILIFFVSGLISGMFLKKKYVVIWWLLSTPLAIAYYVLWPSIILNMVNNGFLYVGYIFAYIMAGINLYTLTGKAESTLSELKASNEYKDKERSLKNIFWANISQEIKTPMNVINGMSSLLKTENLNVRSREYTEQIENASGILLNIVNDTLELSNIESGIYKKDKRPYDIYNEAHLAIINASKIINNHNVNMVYCINPRVPNILNGDEVFINKILFKLLTNAVFFTESGEIRLDIDINDEKTTDTGVELIIKVSDSSHSLDSKELSEMFIGYEFVSKSRTTEQESIGLSFKLVSAMVETLGGSINIEDRSEGGASFVVRLKQDIGSEYDYQKLNGNKLASSNNAWVAPSAKILVVDDTPSNLKLISGMIKLYGIEPDLAESGKSAISMMEYKKYDIVFMDYMMPDMNGVDTLRVIRLKSNNENYSNVPVVALTSRSLQKDRERFIDLGFDEFISKPIDDKELENILKKFLIKNEG